MGYFQREDVPGSIHHVWNRGIRRYAIYLSDGDRHRFVGELRDAAGTTGVTIVAYSLMGNHFHLIVHCPDGRLSEMMQRLQSRYARRFNRTHGFDGPLFRSRFQSNRIAGEGHALVAARYVDRNPLELGIDIRTYPWGSYPVYLGNRSSDFVNTDLVLGLAGGRAAYQRFVEQAQPSDAFSISDGKRVIAAEPSSGDELASLQTLVFDSAPADVTARWLRSAAVLVAVDVLGVDGQRAAAQFGFATIGSLRSALCRARKRLISQPDFAAYVQLLGSQLNAAPPSRSA